MMHGFRPIFFASLLAWALPAACTLNPLPAKGQTPDPVTSVSSPYGFYLRMGLEPHLVVSLGYVHRLGRDDAASGAGLGMGLKIPPYRLDHGAGRLSIIAAGHWLPHGRWGGAATGEAFLARGRNRAGTVHGLGLEVRAAPGYYGPTWRATADVGWQGTLLSHISHSTHARETFEERYPDGAEDFNGPVAGWYGSTSHRFRAGLSGMRTLSDGALLRVGAGSVFSIQNQGILLGFAHGQVPAYLEISLYFSTRPQHAPVTGGSGHE
jgi:hypothetical protein